MKCKLQEEMCLSASKTPFRTVISWTQWKELTRSGGASLLYYGAEKLAWLNHEMWDIRLSKLPLR